MLSVSFFWLLLFFILASASVFTFVRHSRRSPSPLKKKVAPIWIEADAEPTEKDNISKRRLKRTKKKAAKEKAKEKEDLRRQKAAEARKKKNKGVGKKSRAPGPEGVIVKSKAGRPPSDFKNHKHGGNLEFHFDFLLHPEPARKALQFGLLYRGTEYELSGCINDLNTVANSFLKEAGFLSKHIVQITDDTEITPTKANMKLAMKQFISKSRAGDRLFLQYSGHGCSVADTSGDEKDGMDEALCPLDGGTIVDDWIFENLVKPLEAQSDVHLFGLFDCCHSGTCLDLPFQYSAMRGKLAMAKQVAEGRRDKHRQTKARVIGFSAALDDQQAMDVQGDIPQGAFTAAFLEVLAEHITKPKSYRQFLLETDGILAQGGYTHQASISSSYPLDLDQEVHFW